MAVAAVHALVEASLGVACPINVFSMVELLFLWCCVLRARSCVVEGLAGRFPQHLTNHRYLSCSGLAHPVQQLETRLIPISKRDRTQIEPHLFFDRRGGGDPIAAHEQQGDNDQLHTIFNYILLILIL